jgi:hypothetical protein
MAKRCVGNHAITLTAPKNDAGGRGSDLAVTAGELNAGAGVGRLLRGGFCSHVKDAG